MERIIHELKLIEEYKEKFEGNLVKKLNSLCNSLLCYIRCLLVVFREWDEIPAYIKDRLNSLIIKWDVFDLIVFNDISEIRESLTAFLMSLRENPVYPKIQQCLADERFYKVNNLQKFDYGKLHHLICKWLFQKIEESSDSKKCFWIQIDHSDTLPFENNDREKKDFSDWSLGDYIRLSVLSNEVLEYDSFVFGMLNEENTEFSSVIREVYRPYFIEYYVDASKLTQEQRGFFTNPENRTNWFKAYFADDENSNTDVERWLFEGVFSYSASPVTYKKRKLVIDCDSVDDSVLNRINRTYKFPTGYCSNDSVIISELQNIFHDVIFNKVRAYRVGNGNCIYSYGKAKKKEKRLLYDIGFDNNTSVREFDLHTSSSCPYHSAIIRIRNLNPHCIIISHWDSDHYKACAYGNKTIFDCLWIAPDVNDAAANAKRLGAYLYKIGKIRFVPRDIAREIKIPLTSNNDLVLYVGRNGGDLSKINCEGIAVKHENRLWKNKVIRCLMMGDVSYKSLPSSANFKTENPYEYLIAPHHGSKMDLALLYGPLKSRKKGRKAVICCNDNKNPAVPDRPEDVHRIRLRKWYREVAMTENAGSYVQINLRTTR